MKTLLLVALAFTLTAISAVAGDVSGTWAFSVDLENGQHGDPIFVLAQNGTQLSGTYQGPYGKQKVTGTIDGNTAHFQVAASNEAGSVKLTYVAKIDGSKPVINEMSGTITHDLSGETTPGKWTAKRKK